MWTLFDLDPFSVFEWNRRRAARIVRKGERARATVTGIRGRLQSSEGGSGTPRWELALDVRGAGGPFRAGVRQALVNQVPFRLGMDVDVLHDAKGRTVVDWGARPGDEPGHVPVFNWKRVDPPADGIDDDSDGTRKALEKGRGVPAVVESVEAYSGFWALGGAAMASFDLVLRLDEPGGPRRVSVSRQQAPPYAGHLLRAGARLPVAVHPKKPDKVTLDWARAATAEPGVGVPDAVPGAEPSPSPLVDA